MLNRSILFFCPMAGLTGDFNTLAEQIAADKIYVTTIAIGDAARTSCKRLRSEAKETMCLFTM